MKLVAGQLNDVSIDSLFPAETIQVSEVKAAIAYASEGKMRLLEWCNGNTIPLEFYCRYDWSLPVSPSIFKWFLDRESVELECFLVPDILHSKVIWWVGYGAYIGSANMTSRAWHSNIEAGVFVEQSDLVKSGMESDLLTFFEGIRQRSHPLTYEIYKEQKRREGLNRDRTNRDSQDRREFEKSRILEIGEGLSAVPPKNRKKDAAAIFSAQWNESLTLVRKIGDRLSQAPNRPNWLGEDVPSGIQADQFLSMYYQNFIQRKARVEELQELNAVRKNEALDKAIRWWSKGDYDYSFSKRIAEDWAPFLETKLSRHTLSSLQKGEFVEVLSKVHAFRSYAAHEQTDSDNNGDQDQKTIQLAEAVWGDESSYEKSVLQVLEYVIWTGHGDIGQRIWEATHSDKWKIKSLGENTICELVGWARPEEYPPRNSRTIQALNALGHSVK